MVRTEGCTAREDFPRPPSHRSPCPSGRHQSDLPPTHPHYRKVLGREPRPGRWWAESHSLMAGTPFSNPTNPAGFFFFAVNRPGDGERGPVRGGGRRGRGGGFVAPAALCFRRGAQCFTAGPRGSAWHFNAASVVLCLSLNRCPTKGARGDTSPATIPTTSFSSLLQSASVQYYILQVSVYWVSHRHQFQHTPATAPLRCRLHVFI